MSREPARTWNLWRVIHEGAVRVRPVFAWFDLRIGLYIDRSAPAIYFFPVPMLGVRIDWPDLPDFYRISLGEWVPIAEAPESVRAGGKVRRWGPDVGESLILEVKDGLVQLDDGDGWRLDEMTVGEWEVFRTA